MDAPPKVVRLTVEWDDGFSVEHLAENAEAVWNATGIIRDLPAGRAVRIIAYPNLEPTSGALHVRPLLAKVLTPAREVPNGRED